MTKGKQRAVETPEKPQTKFEKIQAGIFVYHDKPERLPAFFEVCDTIGSDRNYWKLFGDIWTNSESLYLHQDAIHDMFLDNPRSGSPHYMMTDDVDLEFFEALPNRIRVFRGGHAKNRFGWSWTTNHVVARKFAKYCPPPGCEPCIYHGYVDKSNIMAAFNSRDEQEVVCWAFHVEDMEVTVIKNYPEPSTTARMAQLVQAHGARVLFSPDEYERRQTEAIHSLMRFGNDDEAEKYVLEHHTEVEKFLRPLGFITKADYHKDMRKIVKSKEVREAWKMHREKQGEAA